MAEGNGEVSEEPMKIESETTPITTTSITTATTTATTTTTTTATTTVTVTATATATTSERTEDYQKLIEYGLDERVAAKLDDIYKTGKLAHIDLDERALDALKEFPVDGALNVLGQFLDSNLEHVSNKSAYLCGVMKTYRQKSRAAASGGGSSVGGGAVTPAPIPVKGPDEEKIKQILDRTGYTLDVTTGQRKYGGPPPGWDGPPPGAGCEVFCGKIPKDMYEDELIPLFEACGTIWDLRLMMDPMTNTNRGYAFVTFTTRDAAQLAVQKLDNHEIKPGKTLKINISVPNLRLFVGNIPKSKGKEEILEEFGKLTAGLVEVIIYSSPDDKKKNRGFCFLEYESHKAASLAKRRLGTGRIKVWGCDIIVDWADPQEEPDEQTMSKVKVLYVRNLTQDISEEKLKETFELYGKVERVKKIKDYAFIHFEDRENAVKAMEELDGKEMGGSNIEVSLAKPPSDKKKKEEILRARERRMMQMMQVRGGMMASSSIPVRGQPGQVRTSTGLRGPMGRGDYGHSMAPAHRHTSGRSLVLSILCLQAICLQVTSECDQTFVSRPGGPLNGTFHAPEFVNLRGHSRQCIYTFLAGPGQRVELVFTSFALRGTPPDCVHEYMDVYSEVVQPDAAELINSPFGGRYCGPIPPRLRVSLYRALALAFYTDKNVSTSDLFSGRYTFINDSEYEVGTPVAGSPCSFLVKGGVKPTGVILSPTYPGVYPKALSCVYQFLGVPGQRIRLEFRDFDLFYGGPHCPFDYVRVYDGPDNTSAVIGTYCGQQRNLVIYSSESSLLVKFITLPRIANTQNRGFKGIFEFSNSFTKLDFISKNDGEHIRGTECDQKILSKKESSGFVFSPNYPFPYMPKLVCRYFIYGMQDSQHLERVKLEFVLFEIPKGPKGDCSDGYLKIYLKGQETTDSYDKFDHEMCGDESKPSVVVSDGPRLVMVFSSGELMGRGFKANYTFETEYRIPGTAAPDGSCMFTYRSISKKKGEFNSPRYPSNYPSDTNCTYSFMATNNEQVTLIFDSFKVRADSANSTVGSYGAYVCQEDWLEVYNIYRDGTEKIVGRYCGMTAPGPIESNRGAMGLKIILHADSEGVYSGFKARYSFETAKSIFGDCGGNVSNLESGIISSPKFPSDYDGPIKGLSLKTCNWYISVRQNYKIMLNFERFAVEGEPVGRGCPAAVLRLWTDLTKPPIELCGEKGANDKWQYLSTSNAVRFSFVTADKAVGAQGFKIVWTEVQDGSSCDEFQCQHSGFCISAKLHCNQINNCGADDNSDEADCSVDVPVTDYTLLYICIIIAIIVIMVTLCVVCHRKRHRRRRGLHRPLQLPVPSGTSTRRPPQHVCEELGERYASVDSV